MSPKRKAVIEQIRTAFAGVRLEAGIGLWEAQGLDDYEKEEVCRRYRETDEKEDWSRIPSTALVRCHSSLSFFDAQGMKFHLPAFLIGELEGTVSMSTEFHLIGLDDFRKQKLSTLSPEQRAAVAACLWEMLGDENYALSHEDILRALDEYWMKKEDACRSQ